MFKLASVLFVLSIATIADAGCGASRVGIIQGMHERKAERHQRIADRHSAAAARIGVRRGNACAPATAPKTAEKLPAPKK